MKSNLKILYIIVPLFLIVGFANRVESPTVTPVPKQEEGAVEDPRIQEYLNSEEARTIARIHLAEIDKVEATARYKENIKKIPSTDAKALKAERDRLAMTMYRLNLQLDELKKTLNPTN